MALSGEDDEEEEEVVVVVVDCVCGGDGGRLCRSVQDRTRCNRNVPDELWHRGVARAKSRQSWC